MDGTAGYAGVQCTAVGEHVKTVELKTAYCWTCEDCSEVNFALPQKAELTDDDAAEAYRSFHGLEEWADLPDGWRQFELVWIPPVVECKVCGMRFATEAESL